MKPIHVIAIILAAAFGIVWCFQMWSAGQWKTELVQSEADGSFYENRRMIATAKANVREAFNDTPPPVQSEDFMREAANKSPTPVDQATDVSGASREDRLGKRIDHWLRAIKSMVHRSRRAPSGVYFTLTYISVRNQSGIMGVSAGTQVVCVKDEGPVLLVKAGSVEFEAKRQYLTNDLDIADLAVRGDTEAQQAVASYIAKQQQAIDQHKR